MGESRFNKGKKGQPMSISDSQKGSHDDLDGAPSSLVMVTLFVYLSNLLLYFEMV